MVFVMALYTFPYVFTFVANSLDVIPSELEEASAILGARRGGPQRTSRCRWSCRRCSPDFWSRFCNR